MITEAIHTAASVIRFLKNSKKAMIEIVNADCIQYLKALPPDSIDLVVTSPPYNCGMPYRTYCDSRPWEESSHGVAIGFLCCIESVDAAEGLL